MLGSAVRWTAVAIGLMTVLLVGDAVTASDGRTISFSGITWDVRTGDGGPGNQCWSDSPDSVWVDAQGRLHLRIHELAGGGWCQAEVVAQSFARYGEHTFAVDTQLDLLDPDIVFAMFAYANDRSEIDIEVTQAFDDGPDKIFNVVHGCVPNENQSSSYVMTGGLSTHRFTWLSSGLDCAGTIDFESWHGHCPDPPCEGYMVPPFLYDGENVPCEGENLRPRLSLWLCTADWCSGDGIPSGTDELEVVISEYIGSHAQAGRSEEIRISTLKDASIRAGASQHVNYGGDVSGPAEQRFMGFGNTDQIFMTIGDEPVRLLVEFDLTNVPTTVPLESAILQLSHAITYGTFDQPVALEIHQYLGPWSESTVTWANRPGVDPSGVADECFPTTGRYPFLLLDVKSIVEAWLAGSTANNGVEVSAPSIEAISDRAVFFSQREDTGSEPGAQLILRLVTGIFEDGFESSDTTSWTSAIP